MSEEKEEHFKKGVFIQRAKGQRFEDFQTACIMKLQEAGLIQEDEQEQQPDESQMVMHKTFEEALPELVAKHQKGQLKQQGYIIQIKKEL